MAGDVFEALATARRAGRPVVLATTVRTEGDPPSAPGNRALFAADGALLAGTVGCNGLDRRAGRDGRALLERLLDAAPRHLAPGGVLLLVHSEIVDADATLGAFAAAGLRADVAARHHGPLGPLMRERAPELERRGVLAPGEREEELVVIRAERPPG